VKSHVTKVTTTLLSFLAAVRASRFAAFAANMGPLEFSFQMLDGFQFLVDLLFGASGGARIGGSRNVCVLSAMIPLLSVDRICLICTTRRDLICEGKGSSMQKKFPRVGAWRGARPARVQCGKRKNATERKKKLICLVRQITLEFLA
jgi:hypothetical protein